MSSVHVLATTPEGTRAALRAARPLVSEDAVVVVIPSTQAEAVQRGEAMVRQCRSIANELEQPIHVRICICRTVASAAEIVPPGATLVIGGATRRWWPTREERVAARVRRTGRDVVFANVLPENAHA